MAESELKTKMVYVDGQLVDSASAGVSVFDHGLLYGDGVFEGIRVYDGRAFALDEHVDRLIGSAKSIALALPLEKAELCGVVRRMCRVNHVENGYVRLVVTRGKGDLGVDPAKCEHATLICIADNIALFPKSFYETGISAITASQRRARSDMLDPRIKSLNYLPNILAKIEANRAGVQEAIMLNERGEVAECTGDNIFAVLGGTVVTPWASSGILMGITRGVIIDLLRRNDVPVVEQPLTLHDVYRADECFVTGTAAEVVALVRVDGRKIGSGKPGPITNRAINWFWEHVAQSGRTGVQDDE